MCMCVHTEIWYILVFMYVHIHVLMCAYTYRRVYTSVCIHLEAYEHLFVGSHRCMCMHIDVCCVAYEFVDVCLSVCFMCVLACSSGEGCW